MTAHAITIRVNVECTIEWARTLRERLPDCSIHRLYDQSLVTAEVHASDREQAKQWLLEVLRDCGADPGEELPLDEPMSYTILGTEWMSIEPPSGRKFGPEY